MRKTDQGTSRKSKQKFELVGNRQLAVNVPLPLVEVWEELQPEVEHLTGMAGLQIIRAVIEDEVARRVGPRYQPDAASDCRRWGTTTGLRGVWWAPRDATIGVINCHCMYLRTETDCRLKSWQLCDRVGTPNKWLY